MSTTDLSIQIQHTKRCVFPKLMISEIRRILESEIIYIKFLEMGPTRVLFNISRN